MGDMMKDSEGFVLLRRREPEDSPKKGGKDRKEKKRHYPEFRKGSWKAAALKLLRKTFVPSTTEDFHFTKLKNIVVVFDSDRRPKTFRFNTRQDRDKLRDFADGYDDAYVLINAGNWEYLRVPLRSYLKLAEIDRIYIRFRLHATYDESDDETEVYRMEKTITDINDLAYFLVHHRHCIDGVYDIQSECCGFAIYRFDFRVMVVKRNRDVETWKDDLNGFMRKYGLRLF